METQKKWYELEEQAAGVKRLILTWCIYRIFGRKAVELITLIVTLFVFFYSKNIREYSEQYLKIAGIEPSRKNQLKHLMSYSFSLIDKMEAATNRFNPKKLVFTDENLKEELIKDIPNGVFFICSHVGNIEVMRAFLNSEEKALKPGVNIFLSEDHCKIFNGFIKKVSSVSNISTYSIENIGVTTSIEVEEKLKKGQVVFMAGDRIPRKTNLKFIDNFLNHLVEFPGGCFKFAKLMSTPVYYVAAMKEKDKYKIYLQKAPFDEIEMRKEYVKFIENLTIKYPFQFYHFYNFFTL